MSNKYRMCRLNQKLHTKEIFHILGKQVYLLWFNVHFLFQHEMIKYSEIRNRKSRLTNPKYSTYSNTV